MQFDIIGSHRYPHSHNLLKDLLFL